ncbi:MAG: 3-oxoacyl-[acyl-carrier-protein] reductase [Desulfobacterales bacterium]|nr:3-oxoacyl-[acyl-carrier-protein] reductase [Desulfobacterales bacterium]MCP4162311.1 3-oxoacyl-[acyl-carrier-protein] reductase [Deltaproteobacteria bacterium]
MQKHDKRTIVVTGGSRGLGRAIVTGFAKSGDNVFFNYSSSNDEAKVETENIAGDLACGFRVDVTVEDDVSAFFHSVIEKTGRIDVLVNNAGITRDGLIVRMKEKDWDDVLDINLKGVFLCSKIAAKTMMKQRAGSIINISSVVGVSGNPGQTNYVASKAGMIGFTKALAKELAPRNIVVNAIAPGYIKTEMTDSLSEKVTEQMLSNIPLKRLGETEDVTGVVDFLASKKASYITGQVFHVNGGLHM